MKKEYTINPDQAAREEADRRYGEGSPYHHELTYLVQRRLTLDEWIALDDAFEEALEKVGLSEVVVGFAGPVPFGESALDSADT